MRFLLFFMTATLAIAAEFSTSIGDIYPFQVSAITTDSTGNTHVVGGRILAGYGFTGVVVGIPITQVQVGGFAAYVLAASSSSSVTMAVQSSTPLNVRLAPSHPTYSQTKSWSL
jgi:hypothetical protein